MRLSQECLEESRE